MMENPEAARNAIETMEHLKTRRQLKQDQGKNYNAIEHHRDLIHQWNEVMDLKLQTAAAETDHKIAQAWSKRQHALESVRIKHLVARERWDIFRQNREVAVEKYIQIKSRFNSLC